MWLQPSSKWGLKIMLRQIEHSKSTPVHWCHCGHCNKLSKNIQGLVTKATIFFFIHEVICSWIIVLHSSKDFQQYCSGIKSMCKNIQLNWTVSIQTKFFITNRFDGKKWKIRKNLIQVCDFLPAAIWQIFLNFLLTFYTKNWALTDTEEGMRVGVDRLWGRLP